MAAMKRLRNAVLLFFLMPCCTAAVNNQKNLALTQAVCSNSSEWKSYLGDTSKPLPTCWGIYMSEAPLINFPSMTGIEAKKIGDLEGEPLTQALIQWRTRSGNEHSESGLAINTLSITGGGSKPQTRYNEKVGLYMPTILAPGGANTWGINVDTTILSEVGRYPAFGFENDFTNFNGPYTNASDSFGVSASYFNTFLSSFPVTAGDLWSASNQKNAAVSLVVSVTKGKETAEIKVFTRGSFKGLYLGETAQDNEGLFPSWTRISKLVDKNRIILSGPARRTGTGVLTFVPSGAQYGFLVNSLDVFSDATFADFGNAETSIAVAGTHKIGVSIGGEADYGVVLGDGLPICYAGLTACERWTDGKLQLEADHRAFSYSSRSTKLDSIPVKLLPECNASTADTLMSVMDASKIAYDALPVGGGKAHALVFCDGHTWAIH